jgi:hypothetical protein
MKNQKNTCDKISNFALLILKFIKRGKINKINIDKPKQITPPSLFGIDRKIA